jgi:hypothetical protein
VPSLKVCGSCLMNNQWAGSFSPSCHLMTGDHVMLRSSNIFNFKSFNSVRFQWKYSDFPFKFESDVAPSWAADTHGSTQQHTLSTQKMKIVENEPK